MAAQIVVMCHNVLPGIKDFLLALEFGGRRCGIVDGIEDGRQSGGPDNVGCEKYGGNDQCHDGQDDKSVG